MAASRVVTVEIQGGRYPVRSDLDANYVAELATYVDGKMRLASRESSAADSMRIAVIAALNIADELFRARADAGAGENVLLDRAAELERIVDAVLARETVLSLADERPTGTNA
ncbi:MAG: cell division protein ZapA [Acidobacteriota bacterium]|nr:cell division protein ZapA [Acidobacteriota bacterium]